MTLLDRAVASLRVIGDELIPDEITDLLGANPTSSFARGDEVIVRTGRTRTRTFGLWSLAAPDTEPADLDAQVEAVLNSMTDDLAVWRDLRQRFRVDLFCGWFMRVENEGLNINANTLDALGRRQIDLNLDFYADIERDTG